MPAKDTYHEAVKNALVKDGWTITHDPLRVVWGPRDAFVDLGAEQVVAANRDGRSIAIEIKSFSGLSLINDLEKALGQYLLYRSMMIRVEASRELYLALEIKAYREVFEESVGSILLEDYPLSLVVFDAREETIVKWIP